MLNQLLHVITAYMPTRNDYTAQDYAYSRRLNLLLQGWTVPTVNLLGAVDDGPGHWADALHPNDLGHAELLHA